MATMSGLSPQAAHMSGVQPLWSGRFDIGLVIGKVRRHVEKAEAGRVDQARV